ncbi:MAG TPA: cation:proton antiporter [Pirellulaceae bacterium]|nr:cation:proton antiporter [Pirellulaceae bacterium]
MHDTVILTIAIGFGFALLFGTLTNRLGLSPIVGYLIAGFMVGPRTPGPVADPAVANQLAEVGVILLMFGVGLEFHFKDLLRVKSIAVPGAVFQILAATACCTAIGMLLGLSLTAGLLLGVAVSVASTVVLVRVLMDYGVLHTPQGHVAVGWLVVEDLFTVVVLVLMPALTQALAAGRIGVVAGSILWTILKIVALVALVMIVGTRLIPLLMNYMARTRSRELFTLSVLAVALGIATGSALVFGVSMALGAFLAGMVVSQSDVSQQAASDALPMRDAFAVLFFVSVGMLFDPASLPQNWLLTLGVLGVILVIKPLAALIIVMALGYPIRTALTVAVALAQIGEFSFILGSQAVELKLLSATESSVLVTCAIVSITLNPLLFQLVAPAERYLQARPHLLRFLKQRRKADPLAEVASLESEAEGAVQALVIGYGPVGQTLTAILRDFKIRPLIIDLNVDTVRRLRLEGTPALYGDANSVEILRSAGIDRVSYLLLTLPDEAARYAIIATALTLNPQIKIISRARYVAERDVLKEAKVSAVAYEEAEVAAALGEMLLKEVGVSEAEVMARSAKIRSDLSLGDKQ